MLGKTGETDVRIGAHETSCRLPREISDLDRAFQAYNDEMEKEPVNPNHLDPATMEQEALPPPNLEAGKNGTPLDEADTEEMNYVPMPPKRTVTISVQYKVRGRGRPLPYLLDDGE